MAYDILEHHDGVVHHESNAEDKSHHREVVEAVVEQVHHRERADDREGKREAGDRGRRDIAQEQEDDRDHQPERQAHGEQHVVVRLTNRVRAVVENVDVDRRRQLPANQRQQLLDAVGDFNRVGARLALHSQNDGPLAVGLRVLRIKPRRRLVVLDAVLDAAQLLQAHRTSIAVSDDQRPVRRRRHQLAARL